jgi:hypothetical protein
MAKFIVVLAHAAEVHDFYKHFRAGKLKKDMGWNFAFDICDPDRERPGKKELSEIEKNTGLTKGLVGDFSHLLGEFFLNTQVDYGNFGSPKDFNVMIVDDEADTEKLKVFSALKGFNLTILEIKGSVKNLTALYEVLEKYCGDEIGENDVLGKFGWGGIL